MALAGVVFDYSVLLEQQPATIDGLKSLLDNIRDAGLKIVVVSTHRQDINAKLADVGLPLADYLLFQAPRGQTPAADEVRASKGSPEWMIRAAQVIGCDTHQLVNFGDEHRDWTGAIGAAVLHLHAGWARAKPPDVKTYSVTFPSGAWLFLTHFLLPQSRFKFALDMPGECPVYFRSLYTANSTSSLPATNPPNFALVNIFTDGRKIPVQVGHIAGGDLLMIHTLTSLYEEGLIDRYSRFTVYPGHSPGTYNETLTGYVDFLAKNVQAYDRDIIVRGREAPDTSKLRRDNPAAISFGNQTDSVHLNPNQKKNVKGKSIIVFDDFTTDGNGLDWARLLLVAGGAKKVVLVTIGKFVRGGTPTQLVHCPAPGVTVKPFELSEYGPEAFLPKLRRLDENDANATLLSQLFEAMRDKKPFGP